jgi:integrase
MSLAARSVPFAERSMSHVRRSDVETWIKQMNAAGLAPGTIKTRYVNVRSVFRAAVKDRVIGSDPTDGVRLPPGRRADVAMSIPAPEEVGQLMAVADQRFQPFIALCAFAGLRLGEAAAVRLDDIDFLRRSLQVSRQVQRLNGGAIEVRAPKYGSERVVYLADSLINVLAETSPLTAPQARIGGCSPGRTTTHLTRTPSATGGARRCATPTCPASSSTTYGTSTPPA